jgi:16S rRNA (cytosine967-C5)-methyltransferase
MAEGVRARAAAVAMLDAVLGEGGCWKRRPRPGWRPADRARALRLAAQVLRRIEPADRVLARASAQGAAAPGAEHPAAGGGGTALGAPGHGVVNAAVAIARRGGRRRIMAGLVNAVLRAVPGPAAGSRRSCRAGCASRWCMPGAARWWRRSRRCSEGEPPLDLTLRPGAEAPEGELLPTGSLRLAGAGQVSALPGYAAGGWWVQDAAAALPARLLAAQPGERVLDLCAAPGGKTLQLARRGRGGGAGHLGPRMAAAAENLARTGLRRRWWWPMRCTWQPEAPFDAILLDAPCSATGTLRRHPDLPFVKDGSEVAGLVALQAR